jgi:hypothetical protein
MLSKAKKKKRRQGDMDGLHIPCAVKSEVPDVMVQGGREAAYVLVGSDCMEIWFLLGMTRGGR